ncbi:MAG: hypothetical protein A2542_00930 [Parcubacteria group bacterium RIFOXYD2_FULL_52_8]|nr:MAG: hypothetical protein A2542_00930 [Parcubacteria group bacterium RIFOXYD2_FULL_52_8]
MKFVLTSAGITNKSIAKAVVDVVGLPKEQIKMAFVPTAADRYDGDKGWLIQNLQECKEQGYAQVDVVPMAAIPVDETLRRLEESHVIFFGGGSEYRLLRVLHDTGLYKELPRLLETRLYLGLSAGAMIVGHFVPKDVSNWLYVDDQIPEEYEEPYGWVDCIFFPHLNGSDFTNLRKENIESLRGMYDHPIYALDDQSALKVVDGKMEVITEGEYVKIGA